MILFTAAGDFTCFGLFHTKSATTGQTIDYIFCVSFFQSLEMLLPGYDLIHLFIRAHILMGTVAQDLNKFGHVVFRNVSIGFSAWQAQFAFLRRERKFQFVAITGSKFFDLLGLLSCICRKFAEYIHSFLGTYTKAAKSLTIYITFLIL